MSSKPSASLVKLPSERVIELAGKTLARIDGERERRRASFNARVDELVARRAASRWRWLFGTYTHEQAADYLNMTWDLQLLDFWRGRQRTTAARLLHAANLAPEVWVSISDLEDVAR